MSKTDLSQQFAAFAGRTVTVTEKKHELTRGDKKHVLITVALRKNDPAVTALTAAAKEAGLTLRLLVPGRAYTDDYNTKRLNAQVIKDADGSYRIGASFNLG